jgi:predicted membrane-bound spermidine synthase
MASSPRRPTRQARQPGHDPPARAADPWRMLACFAGAGALALGTQVLLLREYLVTLQGDEVSIGLGLGSWLTGISVGAGLARSARLRRPDRVAAWTMGLLAILAWTELVVARLGRQLIGVPVGELAALGPSLWLALLVFALPGTTVGAGFVALAASAERSGILPSRAIPTLYVAEAAGSLLSGLLVSLVLIPTVSPVAALGLLTAFGLAAITPAASSGAIAGRRLLPALCAAALVASLPPVSRRVEARSERARFAALVPGMPLIDWASTPYQHLALGGRENHVLYAGGQYATSFPDPEEDEGRAHRWMLLAEQPERVLVFGGLPTGVLRFMLRHPVARLDWVLYHPGALDLVRRHMDAPDRRALADPRVHLSYEDPRRFLAEASRPYDLIVCLEANPSTLLLARDRSVQFSRLVARRLSARGTYVSRFPAGPNVQAGDSGRLGAALYRSLTEAFPVVHAAPGPDGLLVAGRAPGLVTLSPERLAERWHQRGLSSDVFVPELLPLAYPPERVAALEQQLRQQAARLEPSSDDRPVSFLYASAVRGELAQSAWPLVLRWATHHRAALALAGLGPSLLFALYVVLRRLVWLLSRRSLGRAQPNPTESRPAKRRVAPALIASGEAQRCSDVLHATAVTGASGMAYGIMLFYSFQSRVGMLYAEIGALTALFMLGLALGGMLGSHPAFLARAQTIGLGTSILVAVSFALMERFASSGTLLALCHGSLLVWVGAATGVVFPSAGEVLMTRGFGLQRAAAWVELADHAGAAVAALLAAAVFVPVFGLTLAATLLVLLQGLALLITLNSRSIPLAHSGAASGPDLRIPG